MKKDFDRWNEMKKQLEREAVMPPAFPKNGEVWMCTLGKNLGREQNGGHRDFARPVLVSCAIENTAFAGGAFLDFASRMMLMGTDLVKVSIANGRSLSRSEIPLWIMNFLQPAEGIEPSGRELTRSVPHHAAGWKLLYHGMNGFLTENRNPATIMTGRGLSEPSETEGTV